MQARDFCYWLQGHFELSGENIALNDSQIAVIKEHLQLVFHKETLKETTHISIPQSKPPVQGSLYPNPLGWPSWDEEFGHTRYCGDGQVPSPLGSQPGFEGSC